MRCEPVWESMQVNPGPLGQLSLIPWTGNLAADSQEAQLEAKTTGGLSIGDQQLLVPALAKSTQRCLLLEFKNLQGCSLQGSAEESRTGVSPASLQAPVTGLSWWSHCLPVQRTPSAHSQPFLPHPQPTTLGDETAREPREATGLLPAPHDHGPAAGQIPL